MPPLVQSKNFRKIGPENLNVAENIVFRQLHTFHVAYICAQTLNTTDFFTQKLQVA